MFIIPILSLQDLVYCLEESQENFQCMQFIQSNDSGCQVPANTNLRIEQSPMIVLTNPVDVTFVTDKQGLIVNSATLPSGIVVPRRKWKKLES
jgi:hypothetical protein